MAITTRISTGRIVHATSNSVLWVVFDGNRVDLLVEPENADPEQHHDEQADHRDDREQVRSCRNCGCRGRSRSRRPESRSGRDPDGPYRWPKPRGRARAAPLGLPTRPEPNRSVASMSPLLSAGSGRSRSAGRKQVFKNTKAQGVQWRGHSTLCVIRPSHAAVRQASVLTCARIGRTFSIVDGMRRAGRASTRASQGEAARWLRCPVAGGSC